MGLCGHGSFCEESVFEVLGSCAYLNKEESLPLGAALVEDDDAKTAEEEAAAAAEGGVPKPRAIWTILSGFVSWSDYHLV